LAKFMRKIEEKEKPCRLYVAPFDVSFPEKPEDSEEETETVVQPDLVVICDESLLNDKGCKGAPDFVVEILYCKTIQVFLYNGTDYNKPDYYKDDEEIKSHILEGFQISLPRIFETI